MRVVVNQGENFVATNEYVLGLAAGKAALQPVFVLVPDRFTLQAERLLLQKCGRLLNTRVLTFSMLFQVVSEELSRGEAPVPVLDKTTAVLSLWTAIRAVQDELLWFKKSVAHYDFAAKMYNTINQMRSSCVDFAQVAATATTVVAQKKYHDINLIYQKYQAILQGQTDSCGMLEYLRANLKHSETIRQADFYVCGFESLSPARLAVLDEICKTAHQVTIGASQPELINQLAHYPWRQINTPKFTPARTTARTETERHEAVFVAEQIVGLLNQGVKPEAITVLLTEFDTLAPVWQVVFDHYQIPTNLDVGQKLSDTADAKYLRDLLELALNDNAENTVAVIFNQCSGLGENVYALENKILKSNLRARYLDEVPKLTYRGDIKDLCAQLAALTTVDKLRDICTKIATGLAGQDISLREFIALFWTLCTATKISNIPLYRDRILVAPVDDWVPTRCQYLFIANCTAENFPKGQADDDILQEADLVGTHITPTPKLQRERNYRHAQLLLTVATTAVRQSGPCEEFTPVSYTPVNPGQIYDDQSNITVGEALFFADRRVKTTLIEKYYSCPYLNFIQNGLRLQPREIYELKPNRIGAAIHKALETYFRGAKVDAAVAAGLRELDYDCPPLVTNLAKEMRFIIQQLAASLAAGQFQIYALEHNVTSKLANGWDLVGRVDRVDVATTAAGEKVILVLDYKTGTAPSSIAKNIYLGSKLQLPLYAAALRDVGQIAGAGYLSLPSGYAAQASKELTLKGYVNQDYRDLFAPQLLSGSARQFVDGATITQISRHAQKLVDQAVSEICAGVTKAQAVDESVCKYCPVNLVCPQAGRHYRGTGVTVSFQDFTGGGHD